MVVACLGRGARQRLPVQPRDMDAYTISQRHFANQRLVSVTSMGKRKIRQHGQIVIADVMLPTNGALQDDVDVHMPKATRDHLGQHLDAPPPSLSDGRQLFAALLPTWPGDALLGLKACRLVTYGVYYPEYVTI